MQAIQAEYYSTNPELSVGSYAVEKKMNTIRLENAVESSLKFDLAETFLIISFILFASLYLPYQFYSKYQRSEESLQQA